MERERESKRDVSVRLKKQSNKNCCYQQRFGKRRISIEKGQEREEQQKSEGEYDCVGEKELIRLLL